MNFISPTSKHNKKTWSFNLAVTSSTATSDLQSDAGFAFPGLDLYYNLDFID